MISQFGSFDEFIKRAQHIGITSDLNALLTLDIIFYEEYDDYLIVSLVDFDSQPNKILIVSDKECLVYPEIVNVKHSLYSGQKKGRSAEFRESTVTMFLALKRILGSYTSHYEKLNKRIEHVGDTLDLDEIEEVDRHLKKFSDVVHSFESLLIELEESTLKFVNVELIGYDYDLLLAKATHLAELCRGLKGELSIIRDKTEARYSKELNINIERLTKIMASLTMMQLLIAVPMLIASIYGMNIVFPWGLQTELGGYPMLASPAVAFVLMFAATFTTMAVAYYYMQKWKVL